MCEQKWVVNAELHETRQSISIKIMQSKLVVHELVEFVKRRLGVNREGRER